MGSLKWQTTIPAMVAEGLGVTADHASSSRGPQVIPVASAVEDNSTQPAQPAQCASTTQLREVPPSGTKSNDLSVQHLLRGWDRQGTEPAPDSPMALGYKHHWPDCPVESTQPMILVRVADLRCTHEAVNDRFRMEGFAHDTKGEGREGSRTNGTEHDRAAKELEGETSRGDGAKA